MYSVLNKMVHLFLPKSVNLDQNIDQLKKVSDVTNAKNDEMRRAKRKIYFFQRSNTDKCHRGRAQLKGVQNLSTFEKNNTDYIKFGQKFIKKPTAQKKLVIQKNW